jgi:hypothetical protein
VDNKAESGVTVKGPDVNVERDAMAMGDNGEQEG